MNSSSTLLSFGASNISLIEQHERAVYGIVAPCVCVMGIFFNAAILLLLHSKRDFQESTYVYLFDLAMADLLTLFFYATNCIGRAYYPESYDWRVFEIYFYFPFGSMVSNASIILTVTVTVERFIFIYQPLKSKLYCTPLIAARVTKCIWIFCFIFNLPRFFVMVPEKEGQLTFTAFGTSLAYKIIVWVYFVGASAGPSLLLIVFNWLLVLGIHRRRHQQNTLKGKYHGSVEYLKASRVSESLSTMNEEEKVSPVEKNTELTSDAETHLTSIDEKNESLTSVSHEKNNNDLKVKCLNSKNAQPEKTLNEIMTLKLQQKLRDDFTLTLTLVVLVVVFLLGEVPSALMSRNSVVPFLGEGVLEKTWYRRILITCTILVINQHSTNFIVYCALNRKFCTVLKRRLKFFKRRFRRI